MYLTYVQQAGLLQRPGRNGGKKWLILSTGWMDFAGYFSGKHSPGTTIQGGAPPVRSSFIIPLTIDITP